MGPRQDAVSSAARLEGRGVSVSIVESMCGPRIVRWSVWSDSGGSNSGGASWQVEVDRLISGRTSALQKVVASLQTKEEVVTTSAGTVIIRSRKITFPSIPLSS